MADHNKRGVPLTIRPLIAFCLPCKRAHVWVSPYCPFSATAAYFTIDSCLWKKVIETPVSELTFLASSVGPNHHRLSVVFNS